MTVSECGLIKLFPCILFQRYICILALAMASPGNGHCAKCIGTLSFPISGPDRQGSALGAYAPPKWVKYKIKNTDIVHNAPCVEERSTLKKHFLLFYKNTPIFHFLQKKHFPLLQKYPPPFSTFLQKNTCHFPLFYESTLPHFISYLRAWIHEQYRPERCRWCRDTVRHSTSNTRDGELRAASPTSIRCSVYSWTNLHQRPPCLSWSIYKFCT